MEQTLLEKALSKPVIKQHITRLVGPEDIELALAWTRDEVSLTQVSDAYDIPRNQVNNTYIKLARALKAHLTNKV
jgi:hypothetical protein